MGKYRVLGRNLDVRNVKSITMSFSEIESILGFPLPNSSKMFRSWWANDITHSQAKDGWINFGYQTQNIDLIDERVTFIPSASRNTVSRKSRVTKFRPQDWAAFVRDTVSKYFGTPLNPGKKEKWPKLFDYVSKDYAIVGDAKYYSMTRGKFVPSMKLSVISAHVWMLEKIEAPTKFLLFGNDRRVPNEWWKRYGRFNDTVDFYFYEENEEIQKMEFARAQAKRPNRFESFLKGEVK
jgi:hypothetical protein